MDFQLLDNGQAAAALTPEDHAGFATVLPAGTPAPTWTASDPGLVVTPGADGLSAIVAPANPPVLVTGATVSAQTTLPDGTVISGTSDPIDVVAGGAAGFKISLS